MYKIAVYSICKDELDNVDKWYESAKQADEIYILDTGSTDGTLEKLKELDRENKNFHLYEKSYEIFSFGDAWNTILEKIPTDINFVFRLDMDQYICNRYWYFELQLFLMHSKINLKKTYNININLFEKNFARKEAHQAISSFGIKWAGGIHERHYFPNVESDEVITLLSPITVFHNQKYPSTSNTGIEGCQKKHDFYTYLSIEEFLRHKTVFNFLIYLTSEEDFKALFSRLVDITLGDEVFEICDKKTTNDVDYKPQIADIFASIIFTFLATRSIENYLSNEQNYPLGQDAKHSLPYVSTGLDMSATKIFNSKCLFDIPKTFREFLEVEYNSIQELFSKLEEALSSYNDN